MKQRKNGVKVREKLMEFLKNHKVTLSPVSIRDIMEELKISSTSVVHYHLNVLEYEGKIKRNLNKARMIEVVDG